MCRTSSGLRSDILFCPSNCLAKKLYNVSQFCSKIYFSPAYTNSVFKQATTILGTHNKKSDIHFSLLSAKYKMVWSTFFNLIWLDFQMTLCVVFTIARLVTHSYLMALSSNIFIFLPALLALYRYSFMWYISLSGDIWYISLENNALSRLIGVNTIFL